MAQASGKRESRGATGAARTSAAADESAARLNGIIQSAMDAIITLDERQDIVIFNPAAEHMFGRAAADVVGTPLDQLIPPRYREAHRRHIERFSATGVTSRRMGGHSEIVGLRANGQEFPMEASISQLAVGAGKLFSVIVRDITERKHAENQLRESREQLRALSGALQAVREEEKAHIARELHDELGQALTGLKMDLADITHRLGPDQVEALGRARDMSVLLDSTVAAVRRIATELRPLMLDDLGLVSTIEWLAHDFSKRTGVPVELSLPGAELALSPALSTALFRVLQESLTNVARHAGASRVNVVLARSGAAIELRVEDNGSGIHAAGQRQTFGLLGMRERAAMVGGELSVESRRGAGTRIVMTVPLGSAAADAGR